MMSLRLLMEGDYFVTTFVASRNDRDLMFYGLIFGSVFTSATAGKQESSWHNIIGDINNDIDGFCA